MSMKIRSADDRDYTAACLVRLKEARSAESRVEIGISEFGLAFISRRVMDGNGHRAWSRWEYHEKLSALFAGKTTAAEILAAVPASFTLRTWIGSTAHDPIDITVCPVAAGELDFRRFQVRLPRTKTVAMLSRSSQLPRKRRHTVVIPKPAHIPLENAADRPTDE